jgi:DNA-binding response OmpR family regulator
MPPGATFDGVARVLIVVDEPDTLLLWRRHLEAAGHQVAMAADADTARELLAARPIDVVVVDVMMPVWDGWSLLEARAALAKAPLAIVASRRAGPTDRLRATRLGADVVMPAPFTLDDLVTAVTVLTADAAAAR